MKKKIIALCLIVALAATAVVGGTLAYFTDVDEVNNTFTMGKVDIKLPISSTEQEKIGACFCNLDKLITVYQRKLNEEKQKKKALMQLLLTGIVRV